MTRKERDEVVAVLRDAYIMNGSRLGPACGSKTCLRLATRRVFWPVLKGESFPIYCDACAAWAVQVLETLGLRADSEALLRPASSAAPRAVAIGGVPAERGEP